MKTYPNKFEGPCVFCEGKVMKGYGVAYHERGKWNTAHPDCFRGDVRIPKREQEVKPIRRG
jgi:hypothetical protein